VYHTAGMHCDACTPVCWPESMVLRLQSLPRVTTNTTQDISMSVQMKLTKVVRFGPQAEIQQRQRQASEAAAGNHVCRVAARGGALRR
jgi:hypothetical protein